MNTMKRISVAMVLAFALIPVLGFAQVIKPFDGKEYSNELYQAFHGSNMPDVRLLLGKCIVNDNEGVRIQGSDMESVKDLLSRGMGTVVLGTHDVVFAGDKLTVVSLITGSGLVKNTMLVFKDETGNGCFKLLMGAHFYDTTRSHSFEADEAFEKMCLKELESIYKSRYYAQ